MNKEVPEIKGKRKIELEFIVHNIEKDVPELLRFSWMSLHKLSKPDLKKRYIWIKEQGWCVKEDLCEKENSKQ